MNNLPFTITGNLVRDPELRFTPAGVAVVKFTVAHTPRKLDRESGKWIDGEPTFLDCTAWRQLAENIAESVSQGARVIATGTLRTERWETDGRNGGTAGEKRSRMVLDVDAAGPELTWATAKVSKASRSNGGPADDPWATASRNRPTSPAPTGASRRYRDDEEPPF
ncbi:single-stranded DNA-binding protein [Micromonospora sp. DH14]|uniref:single-stranded DNA-binding protein n=1 Tax=Micromonospora sp. DH14 TaxID=3040120 RepID=UPI002442DE84|nr:single-stranded DNA-binding protein [Micromonospora sp. DH14]MDG9679040.1 single-stranded DNA-binding protein [Micromonospora sp. DH14]